MKRFGYLVRQNIGDKMCFRSLLSVKTPSIAIWAKNQKEMGGVGWGGVQFAIRQCLTSKVSLSNCTPEAREAFQRPSPVCTHMSHLIASENGVQCGPVGPKSGPIVPKITKHTVKTEKTKIRDKMEKP